MMYISTALIQWSRDNVSRYTIIVINVSCIAIIASVFWGEFFLIRCEVLGQGCHICKDCKTL